MTSPIEWLAKALHNIRLTTGKKLILEPKETHLLKHLSSSSDSLPQCRQIATLIRCTKPNANRMSWSLSKGRTCASSCLNLQSRSPLQTFGQMRIGSSFPIKTGSIHLEKRDSQVLACRQGSSAGPAPSLSLH